jgi:hypothetical protein
LEHGNILYTRYADCEINLQSVGVRPKTYFSQNWLCPSVSSLAVAIWMDLNASICNSMFEKWRLYLATLFFLLAVIRRSSLVLASTGPVCSLLAWLWGPTDFWCNEDLFRRIASCASFSRSFSLSARPLLYIASTSSARRLSLPEEKTWLGGLVATNEVLGGKSGCVLRGPSFIITGYMVY